MKDHDSPGGLDAFTIRYLKILGIAAVVGLLWWLSGQDSRVGELNDLLEADTEIASYPYTFKVLALQNGVAQMSSPRSAQASAVRFLRLVEPSLANTGAIDPSMMAAQEQLASVQSRAAGIVQGENDVKTVRWVLDRDWYGARGVILE